MSDMREVRGSFYSLRARPLSFAASSVLIYGLNSFALTKSFLVLH